MCKKFFYCDGRERADDEDFSLEGLILSDKQRKVIDKLDMNTQLTVIRALREQQGIEKPKPKKENSEKSELDVLREKVDEVNREVKVADNAYAGIKSDARVEKEDNKKGYKQADDIQKQRILSPNEIITDFPITISGMLAASHKESGPMTAKYLKSLEKNKDGLYYLPYHKYKGNTLRSFLAIETRLREFSELNTDY